jgi:hypothetical protein
MAETATNMAHSINEALNTYVKHPIVMLGRGGKFMTEEEMAHPVPKKIKRPATAPKQE